MTSSSPATVSLVVLVLVGCGDGTPGDQPDIGRVTGIVTLDGSPLPEAKVEFEPESGRPSLGETDANGKYELKYTLSVMGAKVGKHTVKITTYNVAEGGDGEIVVAQPEKVPDVYNTKSELQVTVEPGDNDIPFELDSSKGELVQPK